MEILTLAEDLRLSASGGVAQIFNPINMELLENDSAAGEWVHLLAGTQIMLTGMFNDDVYLIVVTEGGDMGESEETYGLVLRRASWKQVEEVAVRS